MDKAETKYLLQDSLEAKQQIQQIKALLESEQKDNWILAFQLLEGGGLPEEIRQFILADEHKKILCFQYHFWEVFSQSQELKIMPFRYNISHISEEILHFKLLKIMHIMHCNLQEITEAVGHLPHLEVISLVGNSLKRIPESIGNLPKLRILNVRFNQIEEIPTSIFYMDTLEKVYLYKIISKKFLKVFIIYHIFVFGILVQIIYRNFLKIWANYQT